MPKALIALAWLRREDWPRWQAIDADLPAYEQWLAKMDIAISEIEKRGNVAEKVIVNPDDFVAWCRANGRQIERNARAQFAAELLTRKRNSH
jgi:hypothetical protein